MTMTPAAQTKPLAQRVAAEVRAEMARQMITQKEMARRLEQIDMWLSRRLRGHVPFNLDELERVAQALDLSVSTLIERAGKVTDKQPVRHPVNAVRPLRGPRRPVRLCPAPSLAA